MWAGKSQHKKTTRLFAINSIFYSKFYSRFLNSILDSIFVLFYWCHTHILNTDPKFSIKGVYPVCPLPDRNENKKVKWKWRDVTCGQVWWPILWICALHLTHPKCTHTAVNTHTPWTHTRSSGQPMLRRPGISWGFGVLLKGLTSVVVLKVERALDIHSPHLQFLPDLRLEPTTFRLRVRLSNH